MTGRRRRFLGRLVIVFLAAHELGKLSASCCRSMAVWACEPLNEPRTGCGLPACPVCYPHRHPETPDYSEDTLRGHNDD